MGTALKAPSRQTLATVLPPVVVFASLALIGTAWAAANPVLAAVLFCWLVADALALGTIAKAEKFRPGPKAMLGAFAVASFVILVGSRGAVREAIMAIPAVPLALGLTILAYLGWSGIKAVMQWRATHSLENALAQVFPRQVVALALAETRVLHIALFSWRAPADVPPGTTPFAYHRYLTPMLAVFLALQLIELSVVHFLVMMWNPTVAWVLLAISVWGAIWILALLKSLRLKPVLLTEEGMRVRAGFLIDTTVPYAAIREVRGPLGSDEVKAKTTLNAAIFSWPEIVLELREPLSVPGLFGSSRLIDKVAFKLDEPAGFHALIEQRLSV